MVEIPIFIRLLGVPGLLMAAGTSGNVAGRKCIMSELGEKVSMSIERLKAFAPRNGEGYYLAFSGGKDSVVCKALLDMAGVKYDANYANTSVDPTELLRFIIDTHPDVSREWQTYPDYYKNPALRGKRITMWNLIPEKLLPPTRIARYCCKSLKESAGDDRKVVTGVRWAESDARKKNQGIATIFDRSAIKEADNPEDFRETKRGGVILVNDNEESRRMVEQCYKHSKTTVNPIIEWTDANVWEFIRAENIPYCGLYDEGYPRLGCIGCPIASQRWRDREFLRWPKYKDNYMMAFQNMLDELNRRERKPRWETPLDVFNWWMEYDILPGQMTFDE